MKKSSSVQLLVSFHSFDRSFFVAVASLLLLNLNTRGAAAAAAARVGGFVFHGMLVILPQQQQPHQRHHQMCGRCCRIVRCRHAQEQNNQQQERQEQQQKETLSIKSNLKPRRTFLSAVHKAAVVVTTGGSFAFLQPQPQAAHALQEKNDALCNTGFFTNIAQYRCTEIGNIWDEGQKRAWTGQEEERAVTSDLMSKLNLSSSHNNNNNNNNNNNGEKDNGESDKNVKKASQKP